MNLKLLCVLSVWLMTCTMCRGDFSTCLKPHQVTAAEVHAMERDDLPVGSMSRNQKCFFKCNFADYLDEHNRVDDKRVGNRANPDELAELIGCKKIHDEEAERDPCEYAYHLAQCLKSQHVN